MEIQKSKGSSIGNTESSNS